jgi:hypothetical protein
MATGHQALKDSPKDFLFHVLQLHSTPGAIEAAEAI